MSEKQRIFNIDYVNANLKVTKKGKTHGNVTSWNGKCKECDSTVIPEYNLKKRYYKCAKCRNKDGKKARTNRQAGKKNYKRQKSDPLYMAAWRVRILKCQDRKRNRECDLTPEFMFNALKSNCSYCGLSDVTGVDRLDNSIGHLMSNCVPCCQECNIARCDNFSPEEMKVLGMAIREIKMKRLA